MKRTVLMVIALLLLCLIAWFGYQKSSEKGNSIDVSDREFAISDPSALTRITFTQRTGHKIDLQKKGSLWFVGDDQKRVSPNIMKNILRTLQEVQIKFIPPKKHTKKIINEINRLGIQVDLYNGDELLKSYFVGTNVQEGGTYYLMQGKIQPYVMERKLDVGGFRDLFHYEEYELYDKKFMSNDVTKITSVEVDYPKDKPNSFRVNKNEEGVFSVDPLYSTTRREATIIDQGKVKAYLNGFDTMFSESNDNDSKIIDKIKAIIPFAEVNIFFEDGTEKKYKFYPVSAFIGTDGSLNTIEILNLHYIERFFVLTYEGDLYTSQKQLIRKFFRGYSYFHQ